MTPSARFSAAEATRRRWRSIAIYYYRSRQNLTIAEAASLPEVFATAYLNLCLEAHLSPGETVFVQAGASGVGIAAIQLAKLLGANVWTTVSGARKAAAVGDLGADLVIDRSTRHPDRVLNELTRDGTRIDVVLDCVGGPELPAT